MVAQVWINGGDIILVGLRDYQDGKADVILKYSSDEARNLKAYGELPESGMLLRMIIISAKCQRSERWRWLWVWSFCPSFCVSVCPSVCLFVYMYFEAPYLHNGAT